MSQEKMSDSTSSANPIKSSPLHNPSTLSCAPSSTQTFDFPQSQFYQEKYMKTDLQRHCAFFDRDGDGVISLSDTFSALRALGFNLFNCIGGTLLIHLAMSYQTSPSWIPSPWMPIYLERINRCHHGSSTKAYDFVGNVVSFPAVENVFFHFDPSKQGGLNYWQLIWMIWNLRDSFDPFGWAMSIFWWTGLYLLAANPRSGILSYEVMMAQFNGSLFYLIEQGNKAKKNI